MAEKAQPSTASKKPLCSVAIKPVCGKAFLERDPDSFFESLDFAEGAHLTNKWMLALLGPKEREFLVELPSRPEFVRFNEVAKISAGIVTGANKFFLVPDAIVEDYDLEEFAHPMFGRSKHVPGVIYSDDVHASNRTKGLPTNFIWFNVKTTKNMSNKQVSYIRSGEKQNLHARYKCRIRDPWIKVPHVYNAPVGMLKRCHDFPRLVLNSAGAYTTDTAYRIEPLGGDAISLVGCFVNSLTALSAELEGRHYGGGVLELVPSEINQLMIPVVSLTKNELKSLDRRVRSPKSAQEILKTQDSVVLKKKCGLSAKEVDLLHEAWQKLRKRRQRSK